MKKQLLYTFLAMAVIGLTCVGCGAHRGTSKVPVAKPAVVKSAPAPASEPPNAQAPQKAPAPVPPGGSLVGPSTTVVSPVPFAPAATSARATIIVGQPKDSSSTVLFINEYGKPVNVLLDHGRSGKFEMQDKDFQLVEVDPLNPELIYLVSTPDGVISKSVRFADGAHQEVLIVPKGAGKP